MDEPSRQSPSHAELAARLKPFGQDHLLRLLGRAGRRRPAAAGPADRGDRLRADRGAVPAHGGRPRIGPRWRGGPRRRRRCGWPIARARAIHRRRSPRPRRAGPGGRRDRRAARRGRAGEPARVRSSQGHVSDRAGVRRVAAADPFRKSAGRGAAVRRAGAGLHDDQPGHARRAGRVSRRARSLRPAGGRLSCCSARARCRRSTRRPASCCWPQRTRCS